MQSTITRLAHGASLRLAWLALGAFFAGLTGRVLLWEVHSFSELQAEHYLTIGAIVGAIAAGVFFGPMLRAGKLLSALGLGLAFTAATSYCLIGSAGRGDEAAFERNAKARQVNEERERLQRDLAESKLRYQAAVDAETAECSGGAGPKCIAKRQTTAQRRLDLEADTIRANEMKAEARENGKLKRAAELVSFFGRVEIATAERGLALLWPFVPPLVAELLTIVFLHHAFAFRGPPRRRRERPESGTIADSPTPGPGTVQVPQSQPSRETVGVVVPFRRPTKPTATTEATVLAYVAERLEAGETLPSQATIARRFQLPKQTVSRWMGRWEAAGLLSRTRDGRRNVISAS